MDILMGKKYDYKGMFVHYYISGSKDKEVIVLLHPAFADHRIFQEQFKSLSEKYCLIAIDMISHGKSQVGLSNANMGDMPEVVHEVLSEEGISKVHVVGVSLGSIVAQAVAKDYPGLVKTVTMVGGYSIHLENKELKRKQGLEMVKWIFYMIFSMKAFRRYVVNFSVHSQQGKAVFTEGIALFNRGAFKGLQGMATMFNAIGKIVNYPLLAVYGEYDLELTKVAGKQLENCVANSRYVEIQGAGHCVNIDKADEFNCLLDEFISFNSGKCEK
jgi:3-oxoadipate enol-lactonase